MRERERDRGEGKQDKEGKSQTEGREVCTGLKALPVMVEMQLFLAEENKPS